MSIVFSVCLQTYLFGYLKNSWWLFRLAERLLNFNFYNWFFSQGSRGGLEILEIFIICRHLTDIWPSCRSGTFFLNVFFLSFFSSLSFFCFVLFSVYLTFYYEMVFSAGQVFPSFLSFFVLFSIFLSGLCSCCCSCSWWPRSCCWRHNNTNYWVAVVGCQGVAVGDISDKNYQSLSCCSWWPSSCCWRFIWQVAVAELLRRCGCSWWPRSCCWRHNTDNYWVAVVGGQIVVGIVVVLFTFTIELYSHKNWIQAHLQLESWHFLESGGSCLGALGRISLRYGRLWL